MAGKLIGERCPFCNVEAVFPDPRMEMRTCFSCGRMFPMGQGPKEPEVKRRGFFSRNR